MQLVDNRSGVMSSSRRSCRSLPRGSTFAPMRSDGGGPTRTSSSSGPTPPSADAVDHRRAAALHRRRRGSGKTRVLTWRIVLALPVTARTTVPGRPHPDLPHVSAATELTVRSRALGLRSHPCRDVRCHRRAELADRWSDLVGWRDPGRAARNGSPGAGRRGLIAGSSPRSPPARWPGPDWSIPRSYPEAAVRAGCRPPSLRQRLRGIVVDYVCEKRRRGVVDFDDLLALSPTRWVTTPTSRLRSDGASSTSRRRGTGPQPVAVAPARGLAELLSRSCRVGDRTRPSTRVTAPTLAIEHFDERVEGAAIVAVRNDHRRHRRC